jgi:hypothetical protein
MGVSIVISDNFCKHFNLEGIKWSQRATRYLIPRAYIGSVEAHNNKLQMLKSIKVYGLQKNNRSAFEMLNGMGLIS